MSTTSTNPATWRDLADQLTPYQRNILADSEQSWQNDARPDEWKTQQMLVERAREHIRRHAEDIERRTLKLWQRCHNFQPFGDVPAPAGISHLWHWERGDDGQWNSSRLRGISSWSRAFTGQYHRVGTVTVWFYGQQRPDGSATAFVSLDGTLGDLTADAARDFGRELLR